MNNNKPQKKIIINDRNSFFILKNYLDIGFENKLFNKKDILLINASLQHLAKKLKISPQKKRLDTIPEESDECKDN